MQRDSELCGDPVMVRLSSSALMDTKCDSHMIWVSVAVLQQQWSVE